MKLLAALVLLWLSSVGWTAKVAVTRPATSDSAHCGARDVPITDLAGYDWTLRRCDGRTITLQSGIVDSIDFAVSDSVYVLIVEGRSRDTHGNVSCDYRSLTMAHEATAPPPPPPPDTTSGGLAARYYIGQSRGGAVVYANVENIDGSWGLGSPGPGMPADDWSAEWIGHVTIPTAGLWTWYLNSEDGAQLFLDGTLGINHLVVQPLTEWTWTVNMAAREYAIQVIYRANVGNSECHLSWSGPGMSKQIVPRGVLR